MRNFIQAAVNFVLNAKRIDAVVAAGVNEMTARMLRHCSRLHQAGSSLPIQGGSLLRLLAADAIQAQEPFYAVPAGGLPGSWRSTRRKTPRAFARAS